ncbi:unnamed protein product [Sphagnum balticum]
MEKTFDYYRSTSRRLHAALDQQDCYQRYLGRIDEIVERKPKTDLSASYSMGFRNKMREVSNQHHSTEKLSLIHSENKHLLDKILSVKKRKMVTYDP